MAMGRFHFREMEVVYIVASPSVFGKWHCHGEPFVSRSDCNVMIVASSIGVCG